LHSRPRSIPLGRGPARLLDESLEAVEVELVLLKLDQVAGRPRDDCPSRRERLPKLGDVTLERGRSRPRRRVAPQRLDEAVLGEHTVGVEEQHSQERPLLTPAELERSIAIATSLERSEDPEVHQLLLAADASTAPRKRKDAGFSGLVASFWVGA
jgi:hypothetical protein